MSRVFVSHSSLDNAAAVAIDGWLKDQGWDEVFIDFDPDRGIASGERWRKALNQAANRCEVVIFLVSRNWLASQECRREFDLAYRLSKRLFGVLIDDTSVRDLPQEFTDTWQFTDLRSGDDHDMFPVRVPPDGHLTDVTFSRSGLARLRTGLLRAGLDPQFFAWPPESDPGRLPYRGLSPLDAEDAGIFFGRDAPLVTALDALRKMADSAAPRLFVVQGASGAGKSSFLRAGLLPRLAREDRTFCALPVIRPSRAVLTGDTGLLEALVKALHRAGLPSKRADLRQRLQDREALAALLANLAARNRLPALPGETPPRAPAIVLAVDQAEELFQADGADEAARFLDLLRHLTATDLSTPDSAEPLRVITVFTIRTDSYGPLQAAPALSELNQVVFSLAPMPKGAFETVIEGPARRLNAAGGRRLQIEPALTAALLSDIEADGGRDALPLLAFTLQRLFAEHGGDGRLGLADYQASGRLTGAIEAAVAHAMTLADSDPAVPRDPKARLALLRRGLIPWLAGIDPATNLPRRKVARLSEIPEEARPLIRHLIDARLLSTDQAPDSDEPTIEPAHEAILRQWALLAGWLQEDLGLLTALEGVLSATRDWEANTRSEDWLAHTAGRLEDAERLLARPDLVDATTPLTDRRRAEIGGRLGAAEHAYLAACRTADTARRNREIETARRIAAEATRRARSERIGLVVALVLVLVSAMAGAFAFLQRQEAVAAAAEAETAATEAERQAREALQSQRNAMVALALSRAETDPVDALKLVLAAWPAEEGEPFPTKALAFTAINNALANTKPHLTMRGHKEGIGSVAFSPDGKSIVSGGVDGTLRIWDAATGVALGEPLSGHEVGPFVGIESVTFSRDGSRILSGGGDGTLRFWDAVSGAPLGEPILLHQGGIANLALSPDGSRFVSVALDGTLRVWDATTATPLGEPFHGREIWVGSVDFSPDGSRIVSAGSDNIVRVWDSVLGELLREFPRRHEGLGILATFSPDGSRIVSGGSDGTLIVWDAVSGVPLGEPLRGHLGGVTSVAFSPDGSSIVSGGHDGTLRLWDILSGAPLGKPLRGHEDGVSSAVFSPDGARILSSSTDGTLRLWDHTTGGPLGRSLRGHEYGVNEVAFAPDGKRIVTGGSDGTLRLWDGAGGAPLGKPLLGHVGSISSVAFSPDGSQFFSLGRDGTLRLWETVAGAPLGEPLRGPQESFGIVDFSLAGTRIVGGGEGRLVLWDATTGEVRGEAQLRPEEKVVSVAFSSDGSRIVTGLHDGTLRLWDAMTGAPLSKPMVGPEGWVSSVAFSPDGSRIISGTNEGTLRLWDAGSGAPQGEPMRGHGDRVTSVAFAPDGKRIVSGGFQGTLIYWDAVTGAPLGEPMQGHEGPVNSPMFSPDGRSLVSAGTDGMLRFWGNLPPGNILQVACRYLPRIKGRPDTSTEGLAQELGLANLSLPQDCDTYDPPLPPLAGQE